MRPPCWVAGIAYVCYTMPGRLSTPKTEGSSQPARRPLMLWNHWWNLVCELRSACARTRTFLWMALCLAGAGTGMAQRGRSTAWNLGDVEGLREEALDPPRARHDDLVVLGQLVDPEDRDDVLEVLVLLEDLLHGAGDVVMLLADDQRGEDLGRRGKRVDRGINTDLRDLAREDGRRVEMRECGRGRGVGEVVGGHVYGLHGRDRTLLRGRDALLQLAHFRREVRLVADGRRHAAEERRDLRARLREAEDVVDEQEDVLALLVAEVLGGREAGQPDTQARARRLRHLAVDERSLGFLPVLRVDDSGLGELEPEVVPLARPLADAREDRIAAGGLRDVVDELHDEHGLSDARAAEEAGLAAARVGFEEVDDLDADRKSVV